MQNLYDQAALHGLNQCEAESMVIKVEGKNSCAARCVPHRHQPHAGPGHDHLWGRQLPAALLRPQLQAVRTPAPLPFPPREGLIGGRDDQYEPMHPSNLP